MKIDEKIWVKMLEDFARNLAKAINLHAITNYTIPNPAGLPPWKLKPHPKFWTWRSGRLGRSLEWARWRTGEIEGIFEIKRADKKGVVFTIGSRVPYAIVHERGAVVRRGAVVFRIKPRPYLSKALEDMPKEKWTVKAFEDAWELYKEKIFKQ